MDQSAILATWQEFIARQPVNGHISPFIIRSWQRSQAAAVPAVSEQPEYRRVSGPELERRLEARRELIALAEPHLRWVSASLDVPHAVYLTDQDGIVLRSHGHDDVIDSSGLRPGYDWSELQMGTNGAGTALAAGRPAAVIGAEHYMQAFWDSICTGAPIHGPDGALLGAIDLSTSMEDGNPERLSLVAHLAFTIGSELARRELEREQRWLANVVTASDDAICTEALDGTIRTWNRGAEQLYGYTAQEVVGRKFADLVPENRREELRSIRHKLRRGEHLDRIETKRRRKDGKLLDVSLQFSPIPDENGNPTGATAVARDITPRKRAEAVAERERAAAVRRAEQLQRLAAQLTQAEQRERQKLAQVLHDDLQQVLMAAKMKAGLLQSADAADAEGIGFEIKQLLGEAIESSRTLSHELSPQVLYESGLAAALRWLAPRTEERYGLEVHVEIDAEVDPAPHDVRVLLFQAVRELLLNVLKHAATAEAWVRMAREGDERVRIEVEDCGPGFDPNQLDGDRRGQALGLFGLRERLQAVGGEMRITSAPGDRTRIVLMAPLNKDASRPHEGDNASSA